MTQHNDDPTFPQTPDAPPGPTYRKPQHASLGASAPGAPVKGGSAAPAYDPEAPPLYETLMQAQAEGGIPEQVRKVGMACRASRPCGGIHAHVFDRSADGHSIAYSCTQCKGRWTVKVGGAFQY